MEYILTKQNPLEQGLKLTLESRRTLLMQAYQAKSIRTRIETTQG